MLEIDVIKTLVTLAKHSELDLQNYHPSAPMLKIEAYVTLFKIKKILVLQPHDMVSALVTILDERWQSLQHTNGQYLNDFVNPLNTFCIALATALSTATNQNYLCLLMPSLENIKPEHYLTSCYTDDDVILREIVLSDCNQRIINIPDVIDTAKEDGVLKHNSLIDGEISALSSNEIGRVLSRHVSVKNAMDSITALVLYKLEGDTVGANLNRLIQGLRMGGSKRLTHYAPELNSSEFNSGMDANVAIVRFADYLDSLDAETKQHLFSAAKIDRFNSFRVEQQTIGYLWARLSNPGSERAQGVMYCVELIADILEDILKEHPGLYDLVSYKSAALGEFAKLNETVALSMAAMKTQLSSLQSHECFPPPDDAFTQITLKALKETRAPLRVEEMKFLIQLHLTRSNSISMSDVNYILKNNPCLKEEQQKLSAVEQQVYNELNQNKPSSAHSSLGHFKRKRKEHLSDNDTEEDSSGKEMESVNKVQRVK